MDKQTKYVMIICVIVISSVKKDKSIMINNIKSRVKYISKLAVQVSCILDAHLYGESLQQQKFSQVNHVFPTNLKSIF